jgi:hypothetical protein
MSFVGQRRVTARPVCEQDTGRDRDEQDRGPSMKYRHSSQPPVLDRVLRRVMGEIRDGLRHGYFEFTLSSEIIGDGRRRLQLRAGKNYQFVIPADECDTDSSDLRDEGALDSDHDATHPG